MSASIRCNDKPISVSVMIVELIVQTWIVKAEKRIDFVVFGA